MSTRLLVLIDEHWPSRPAAPWVVLDDAGRVLSEGESEPRHWPAAAECGLVLAGSQCAWHTARLPRGARREEARLLAYALEDRLLRDPETQHLVITDRESVEAGVDVGVLVIARDRLRALVAQLSAIGRTPVLAVSELQSAPATDDAWHLALGPASLTLRSDPRHGQSLDPPLEAALPLLQHALASARAANRAPARVVLHAAPGLAAPAGLDWTPLAVEAEAGPPYLWWQGWSRASNLLQGEFAPRHQHGGWLTRLRWPLRVAAASLGLLLAADLGEVMWQRHQLDGLEARIARLFSTTLPNTPAIAPAAQLARQLDELRTQHGRLRSDDLLTLLAAYGQARGVATRDSVGALSYREGRLELALPALAAGERDILLARLASLGFSARAQADPPRLILAAEPTR